MRLKDFGGGGFIGTAATVFLKDKVDNFTEGWAWLKPGCEVIEV
jgi:hypothetical protein